MIRIAILDDYQGVALQMADWSGLAAQAEITVFHDTLRDPDALVDRLRPFDVIAIMRERTPFDAELLERLPKLQLLVTTGMRNASIDLDAAGRRGIVVCGTSSVGRSTSELALGMMLALARGLVDEAVSVRSGGWQVGVGRELEGATLGILGLGRLGGRMAQFGNALGMDVLAWSRNLTAEVAQSRGARRVDLDTLLAQSDFVSIHLVLSERTRGLIGQRELDLMKPDAFLVNTSRAPIIDTDALVAALRAGRIGGAAVDVFDTEPLPQGHDMRDVPNLLATPHIGYVTRETYSVFYRETVECITAWCAGTPVRVLSQ